MIFSSGQDFISPRNYILQVMEIFQAIPTYGLQDAELSFFLEKGSHQGSTPGDFLVDTHFDTKSSLIFLKKDDCERISVDFCLKK